MARCELCGSKECCGGEVAEERDAAIDALADARASLSIAGEDFEDVGGTVALLILERDEAREEVERLRKLLDSSSEHNVPELLDHYWQWAKSAERARVVAWLREQANCAVKDVGPADAREAEDVNLAMSVMREAADAIEAGGHDK